MSLNGTSESLFGYNTKVKNGELPDADMIKAVLPPLGSVISWLKTYGTADSGTTTSTSANHLVQTGQNFLTTCRIGMIVRNTTDSTYAYITAVNSDTDLTLSSDIMTTTENYTIYKTPYLPDGWVECNGQVLSDSDSPYNGETIPDLNGENRFLMGSSTSGTTGGTTRHSHQVVLNSGASAYGFDSSGAQLALDAVTATGTKFGFNGDDAFQYYTSKVEAPAYYQVVMIMRIK